MTGATDAKEALVLLDLIDSEFQSDPTSVQCFDIRIVKRVHTLVEKYRADLNASFDLKSAESQLALLCGTIEALVHSANGDTVREGAIGELKELLIELPFYKQWRGDGGLK